MTKGNGLPCKKCGTSDWYDCGMCKHCTKERSNKKRLSDPVAARESAKKKYRKNKQSYIDRAKQWKANNKQKVSDSGKRYRKNNKKKVAEANAAWEKNNPAKVKAKVHRRKRNKQTVGGSFSGEEWRKLCDHYDNRCLKCGRDDVKLTADHVIPVVLGGTTYISNIQPLCRSCNSSKGTKTTDYRGGFRITRWIQRKLF